MSDAVEFSRRFALADIGAMPKHVRLVADADECRALARRFRLIDVGSLEAEAELAAVDKAIEARGTISARLVQSCAATARPLEVSLEEPFHIRFEASTTEAVEEEFELNAEDCDVMDHDGLAVDLGEAVAQTLGLAIDPFARAPDADEVLKAAGIVGEEDASPFAKLKSLFEKR
jgi:uncharacterized metal-binding protein YceD (DUF177 family)